MENAPANMLAITLKAVIPKPRLLQLTNLLFNSFTAGERFIGHLPFAGKR